jgi:indolepyruvate ferredoxin oxidoreductase beta subunit
MKMDLVIAGVGGQGNLFASEVISRYAIGRGYNVLGTETIGAAQRGGSVVSHIRLADGPIYSPLVPRGQARVLIGLEPLEMLRHCDRLHPQGRYLLNTYRIPTVMSNMGLDRYPSDGEIRAAIEAWGVEGCTLPATQLAYELGNPLLGNVVLLGALCGMEPFFEVEGMRQALTERAPLRAREMNLAAFGKGISLLRDGPCVGALPE